MKLNEIVGTNHQQVLVLAKRVSLPPQDVRDLLKISEFAKGNSMDHLENIDLDTVTDADFLS